MADYKINDFEAICNHVTETSVVLVKADSKFKTLEDLVNYAKENPKKLKASTNGKRASNHIGAQMLANTAGFKYIDAPYGGTADQLLALRQGEVDFSVYFFAPPLAQLAMKFGSPEYFWLSIFGLTIIAGVSSKSLTKGLISGAFGLLLSTIGMDPIEGEKRFMFGQASLYEGINTTGALIGLFSMSQVLILAEKKIIERAKAVLKK